MNYLDAAYYVLSHAKEPLHYAEIAERAIAQELIAPKGQTPEATMGSRLYVDTKKENSRFKRASKGYFALAEPEQSDEITQRVGALNRRTRRQLRKLLHEMPADKFEALIGELLIAIGFDEATVEVTNYGGDGGIDVRGVLQAGGITRINAAVQVKRWKRNVQVRTVRNVRGSLTTHEQGIIITTSGFSSGAHAEAEAVGKTPISLIDGDQLLELLIQHSIGINKEQHTVLSLDEEWWGELVEPSRDTKTSTGSTTTPAKEVSYPLPIVASNDETLTAQLLNEKGHVIFKGTTYPSPSTAGKEAAGWKSCNGWMFWRFKDPDSGEWCLINELRVQ